jgi:hypothetical protein
MSKRPLADARGSVKSVCYGAAACGYRDLPSGRPGLVSRGNMVSAFKYSLQLKLELLMEMIPVTPERKAQLEEYAKEHGQSPAQALDDLLAAQLEAEQREYDETVQGALKGYEDVKAGRTNSAEEVFGWLRVQHGL